MARQRTQSGLIEVRGDGPVSGGWPNWTERSLGRQGPTVFAVATTNQPLDLALDSYAHQHQAGRLISLQVPGRLDPAGIRGLVRHVADEARAVGHDGSPRHLLLAGPVSLGLFIGAAWNANGPIVVPCGTAARTARRSRSAERYRPGRIADQALA